MAELATRRVREKSTGSILVINADDYDRRLHTDLDELAAAVAAAPDAPEPEPKPKKKAKKKAKKK